ncbi:hypothetical protein Tco_0872737 [Tanacetum coccineum]
MFVKGPPYVNAPAGRPLGAYDLGVATPRALVYAGMMTSGDARSWYMISGDAKSWSFECFCIYSLSYCTIVHCEVNDHILRIGVLRFVWTPAWAFEFISASEEKNQDQDDGVSEY